MADKEVREYVNKVTEALEAGLEPEFILKIVTVLAVAELGRLKEIEDTAREFSQIPYTQARSELGSWRETFSILTNKDCYDQLMKAIKNTKKGKLLSHDEVFKREPGAD